MAESPEKKGESVPSTQDVLDSMRGIGKSAQGVIESARKTGEKADETKGIQSAQMKRSEEALKGTADLDTMIHRLTLSATKLTLANDSKMDEFIEKAKFHLNHRLDEFKNTKDAVKASVATDPEKAKLIDDIDAALAVAFDHYATAQKEWAANPENADEDVVAEQWSRMMGGMKSMERNLNAYDKLRNDYRYFARSFEAAAKRYSSPLKPLNTRNPQSRLEWEDHQSFKAKTDREIDAMWKDHAEFLERNPDPKRDTPRIAELRGQIEEAVRLFNQHQPRWKESQDDRNIVMMSVYMLQNSLFEYMHVDRKLLEEAPDETDVAGGGSPSGEQADRRKAEEEQKKADIAAAQKKIDEEAAKPKVQSRGMTPEDSLSKEPVATVPPKKNQPTLAPPLVPAPEIPLVVKIDGLPGFSKATVVTEADGTRSYRFSAKHPAYAEMRKHPEIKPLLQDGKNGSLAWKDWQTLGGAENGDWRPLPPMPDATATLERRATKAGLAMPDTMPTVEIKLEPPAVTAQSPARAAAADVPAPLGTVTRDMPRIMTNPAPDLDVPMIDTTAIPPADMQAAEKAADEIIERQRNPQAQPAMPPAPNVVPNPPETETPSETKPQPAPPATVEKPTPTPAPSKEDGMPTPAPSKEDAPPAKPDTTVKKPEPKKPKAKPQPKQPVPAPEKPTQTQSAPYGMSPRPYVRPTPLPPSQNPDGKGPFGMSPRPYVRPVPPPQK